MLRDWSRRLCGVALDLLAPRGCGSCGERCAGDRAFCVPCSAGLVRPPVLTREDPPHLVVSAAPYDGPMGRAIRNLKYFGRSDLAEPLGGLLAEAARASAPGLGTRAVPVPLHPRRLSERGYNQSALLCNAVARRLDIVSRGRALGRFRNTTSQARMGRVQRLHNVNGSIHVRRPDDLRGRRVLLVDDVFTTGATAEACIRAIMEAGGSVTMVLVLARADRSQPVAASSAEKVPKPRPG